jgi:methylglutaconyl-CoA hydratase
VPDNASPLAITRDGPVVTLTLQRPEIHNAFDDRLIAMLQETFDTLATDDSARVVVLAAQGPSFSAGADLNWMRRAAAYTEEENRRDALALATLLRTAATLPHPLVARVQGAALGGGMGLVAVADIALAVESALFGFTEARLGLIPATIAPHIVEKIGPGHARALFLTAERIPAARALEIGLVHRVVLDDELDTALAETIDALLAGGPKAHGLAKELVCTVLATEGQEQDNATAALIAGARVSPEGREGIQAFLDKRPPSWRASQGR